MSESYELAGLLKEQQLLKTSEATLKSMIEKINYQLNQLLVEELQLKSRDVLTVETEKKAVANFSALETGSSSNAAEINKQELNLEMEGNILMKSLDVSEDEF